MSVTSTNPAPIFTIEALVKLCLEFDPRRAAATGDSRLCVSPLITAIRLDDEVIELEMKNSRYAAHYIRVSTLGQRSTVTGDGTSESEQIERGIKHLIAQRRAFRVYSDAAVSGEYPNQNSPLIARMLEKKAERFRKVFTRVLLEPAATHGHSAEQIAAMAAYCERRVIAIRRGAEAKTEESTPPKTRRGRPSSRTFYRQGLSQLWEDVGANRIHSLTVNEQSRLSRDADLTIAILEHLEQHRVGIEGLTSAIADLDISDPMGRGVTYLLASVHEARLLEISLHAFRGLVQSLREGRPDGRLPWWLRRVGRGKKAQIEVIPDLAELARRMIQLSIRGMGAGAMLKRLQAEGVRINGQPVSRTQILTAIATEVASGQQQRYGVFWKVLPAIIDAATYQDLQASVRRRREALDAKCGIHDPRTWQTALLTGICRCRCGHLMRRIQVRTGGKLYHYYACHNPTPGPHANINAEVLEDFVTTLVRHHAGALERLYRQTEGINAQAQQVERQALQARCEEAETAYRTAQRQAHAEAEKRVLLLQLPVGSEAYQQVVATVAQSLLASVQAERDQARRNIERLDTVLAHDRYASRFSESLAALTEWETLTTKEHNYRLKSLLSELRIEPLITGGRIAFRLAGAETLLPALAMRKAQRGAVELPNVEDWVLTALSQLESPLVPDLNTAISE